MPPSSAVAVLAVSLDSQIATTSTPGVPGAGGATLGDPVERQRRYAEHLRALHVVVKTGRRAGAPSGHGARDPGPQRLGLSHPLPLSLRLRPGRHPPRRGHLPAGGDRRRLRPGPLRHRAGGLPGRPAPPAAPQRAGALRRPGQPLLGGRAGGAPGPQHAGEVAPAPGGHHPRRDDARSGRSWPAGGSTPSGSTSPPSRWTWSASGTRAPDPRLRQGLRGRRGGRPQRQPPGAPEGPPHPPAGGGAGAPAAPGDALRDRRRRAPAGGAGGPGRQAGRLRGGAVPGADRPGGHAGALRRL